MTVTMWLFACLLGVVFCSFGAIADSSACIPCMLIMALTEEIALDQGMSAKDAIQYVCKGFMQGSSSLEKDCDALLGVMQAPLQFAIKNNKSPDWLCAEVKACDGTCQMFPTWPPPSFAEALLEEGKKLMFEPTPQPHSIDDASSSIFASSASIDSPVGDFWKKLVELLMHVFTELTEAEIDRVFNQHYPLLDHDFDSFGDKQGVFRGFDWRGRDCNDHDASIYPGRVPIDSDAQEDSNCNGIYGTAPNGTSYEELYCANSEPRGVLILGDSAAAHFSLPPSWFTAQTWTPDVMDDLLVTLTNEIDWPACSWSTGFWNASECPPYNPAAPFGSIYSRMVERNRCNHRDFQNLGVNGADSGNTSPEHDEGNLKYMTRDLKNDRPALFFYALIGNDVCSGHPGMDHMTTVEQFEHNVVTSLDYLETILPKGSHVVFIALADGRVLYEAMEDQIHPLQTTYPVLYDYLSCEQANPCWGWLNTNETWRDRTTERAQNLSAVYPKIIKERAQDYQQFEMIYFDPDWQAIVNDWVNAGHQASELIERIDGFHPSSTSMGIIASKIFTFLEENHPAALGPINPFNAQIQELFGDQGGY